MIPGRTNDKFKTQEGGTSLLIPKGGGIQFELLLYEDSTNPSPLDVSNIASLTFMLKTKDMPGNPPAMTKTTAALTNVASVDTWNNGSEAHATVVFSSTETNIVAGDYDVTVYGVTADALLDIKYFGRSTAKIVDVGLSNVVEPMVGLSPGVTLEQLNAAFNQCLRKVMGPGETLTLMSQDSKVRRIMGVLNDASKQDEIEDVVNP